MGIFDKFSKKKKLSITSMCILVEENVMATIDNLLSILKQMNSSFENIDAKLNILSINYELFRYGLYEFNDKLDVNDLMDELYSRIYYNLNIAFNDKYENIINEVTRKSKEIYDVKKLLAPKELFAYRLLLEQLNIKENNISKELIQDLLYYVKLLINNIDNICKNYSIDINDGNFENEKIDFKF